MQETLEYYQSHLGFVEPWNIGTDGGIRRDDMRLIFCEDPEYIAELNNEIY